MKQIVNTVFAMSLIASTAIAQDAAPLSTLSVTEAVDSGFPAEQSTDVLGVRIGMTYDEVFAIMSEKYPEMKKEDFQAEYSYRTKSFAPEVKVDDGFTVAYEAVPSVFQVRRKQWVPLPDEMFVVFGSAATGGVAQAIMRKATFDPPANRADIIESLSDKYGVVVLERPQNPNYIPNENVLLGTSFTNRGRVDEIPKNCDLSYIRDMQFGMTWEMRSNEFYSYNEDRGASPEPECRSSIQIYLVAVDGKPDDISGMTFVLKDDVAIHQDMKAIDAAVHADHAAWTKANPKQYSSPDL